MLKDDNSSSQFKYLEFFASPIKNPTIPSFHGFDDYAERPLPSSTRVRGKRVNLWIQNNTQLHNTSNHGGFTGMHSFTKGGTSGIDYRLTDKFLIGFMGGGAFTDYNLRLNKGNGEVKNVFTGLYGTISMPKDFSLDVSFIVGRNYFKNNRNINLPGLSLVANESHKGLNLSSRFKVGNAYPKSTCEKISQSTKLSQGGHHEISTGKIL